MYSNQLLGLWGEVVERFNDDGCHLEKISSNGSAGKSQRQWGTGGRGPIGRGEERGEEASRSAAGSVPVGPDDGSR